MSFVKKFEKRNMSPPLCLQNPYIKKRFYMKRNIHQMHNVKMHLTTLATVEFFLHHCFCPVQCIDIYNFKVDFTNYIYVSLFLSLWVKWWVLILFKMDLCVFAPGKFWPKLQFRSEIAMTMAHRKPKKMHLNDHLQEIWCSKSNSPW